MNTIILNIEIEENKISITDEQKDYTSNINSNNLDSLFGSDGWLECLYNIKNVDSVFLTGFFISKFFINSYYTIITDIKENKTLEGIKYHKQRPTISLKSRYLKDINKILKFKKKITLETLYSFVFIESISNINELFNITPLVEKTACISVKNLSIGDLILFIKLNHASFEKVHLFKPIWEQGQLYIILYNRINFDNILFKEQTVSQEEETYIRTKIYLATCYDITNKILDLLAEFHNKN
jgi:hypothetical protein